ncbi:MAG: phage tail tape measure protein [Lachnospiraceae bacterium]|nr:phage tail tape measure protein [Lachnospiraceae bacterium]
MQDSTYKLAIQIAGEIEKSFYNAANTTKKEISEVAKAATFIQSGLKDSEPFFSGLESVAVTTFKAIASAAVVAGTAITAGIGASISVGSEFESAFAGVKKTVTATDSELAQMRDELRQMAKEMPMTASGLSEISEAAGQLGIQNENLMDFTKTMADMSVATNLTSEEAATEFAQFANITGMSQEYFDELGSSVVALGNTMATNEADIVSMGMRIAAAGDQVGLSEAEIMAYAASLSSVGIEAEAGGTAFSKLLVNLQMAAETGQNLKNYAKVAGMTGAEFKKAFQEDASGAINAFLAELNDTERNGKSAIAVLTEMGITEVRLRDTLIRSAGASDMLESALKTSDEAWQENVALANEAAQRYATFENQCGILGNKITDIGISIYDDLRPGLTEAITLANDFVDGLAGQEDVIGNMIGSAVKGMPTMVREVKEAGEAVREFSEPFLKVGGWLVENPGVITGTIMGIGTSLATYKIATGIASLATSLGSLGPVGAGILGLGGVAAVITGIGTAVKKSAAEAKQANLAAHFGNIALSMKDIQEAASFIVGSESLEQMRASMEAMAALDSISDEIRSVSDEINKANWKVSIGMELDAAESEDYKNQVQQYYASVQEYVTQQQYAITLSVNTLLGDTEDSNIVTQMNEFYAGKQQELATLGTELNQTFNEAFNDGLLDIYEIEDIENLRQQIVDLQSALANNGLDAELDLINIKYGNELDADSMVNLFAEINRVGKEQQAGLDENYIESKKAWNTVYEEGGSYYDSAGIYYKEGMSKEAFEAGNAEIDTGYLQEQANLWGNIAEFQTGKLREAYGEEWPGLINELQTVTENLLGSRLDNIAFEGGSNILNFLGEDIINSIDIDKSTKDALAEFYEQMSPALEDLQKVEQQYKEAGIAVPESVREGILEMGAIGALSGDTDAIWEVIGQTAESEEYQNAMRTIAESGGYLPEQIAEAIAGNQYQIDAAISQSWQDTQNLYEQTFGQGLRMAMSGGGIGNGLGSSFGSMTRAARDIPGHADGGIFDVPHLAWFSEKGPEAAIPIDGSQNAINLWEKTGELLGMESLADRTQAIMNYSDNSGIQVSFNPVIQVYGNTQEQDIEDALESKFEEFKSFMEQYMKENERRSFR